MPDKITDYPSALTIHSQDLLDKSNTNDGGSTYNQSESFTVDQLMTYINSNVENLYNSDGTLSSNRFIDMAGFRAVWEDGDILLRSDLTDVSISVQNGLNLERANMRYNSSLDSGELELINSDGVFFLASDGLIGVGTLTPNGKIHSKGSTAANSLVLETSSGVQWLIADDSKHIGHNTAPIASMQYSMIGDGSFYGFYVDGTNNVDYASNGGGSTAGFYVRRLNGGANGFWVDASEAATANRTGMISHIYGSNTSVNTALSLRADSGLTNHALYIISGDVTMASGNNYSASSTATQKGSDGAIIMTNRLWDGAANVNRNFEIQAIASTTVNELASLDFSYNGVKKLSLGSNDILEMDGDVEVLGTTKGLILEDRTLNTRHRIYLDNGVISIEAA